MHDTGCLGLVHWDDPEGWNGEGPKLSYTCRRCTGAPLRRKRHKAAGVGERTLSPDAGSTLVDGEREGGRLGRKRRGLFVVRL